MADINIYSEVTPELDRLASMAAKQDAIEQALYTKFDVKRGLRDFNGKGVLAGLTNVCEIKAKKIVNGEEVPDFGHIIYRGYQIEDLIQGFVKENRFGFEEMAYLLLFGFLPTREELAQFEEMLVFYRSLPTKFVRDIIMKAPSSDMMNTLARSVLTLYSYDDRADDTSLANVLRQSLQLISLFPMLSIYGYQAYNHYELGQSLYIHQPLSGGSIADGPRRRK